MNMNMNMNFTEDTNELTQFDLEKLLGDVLLYNTNRIHTKEIFKNKYICLYFSANWCQPCHTFTSILIDSYNKYLDNKRRCL